MIKFKEEDGQEKRTGWLGRPRREGKLGVKTQRREGSGPCKDLRERVLQGEDGGIAV